MAHDKLDNKAVQGTSRANDPEQTRRDILTVATEEFSAKGFSGARVDEIAARTRTSKRMIYYYFTDKEGLYIATLEEAYRRIRRFEATLDLDRFEPEDALKTLVESTFDYQNANPDFVRLVMNENIHNAAYMARSHEIQALNVTVVDTIRTICRRGEASGIFRSDLDAVELHMTISALCFFNVANRATFSTIFKRDLASPTAQAQRRAEVVETVLRYVRR
jgi:AcrR family transcriptional regulator